MSRNIDTDEHGTPVASARIVELEEGEVFVFGSNAGGHHGGGAARFAYERFGAVWGRGHGLQGRSYAIDTMSGRDAMAADVDAFLAFARAHDELTFLVTEIGCGIAGYAVAEVAPLFSGAPENAILPASFAAHLREPR